MILYSKRLLQQTETTDVDKILPKHWGNLKSMGMSVGPDDEKHKDNPKRDFCFVTDKGAFAVSIKYSEIIPTIDEILSAYFVEGDFDETYDGATYTTTTSSTNTGLPVARWCPAQYEQHSKGLIWYYKGTPVRSVSGTTLNFWGWKSEYLSAGTHYRYEIVNGVMHIFYDNKLVMKLK